MLIKIDRFNGQVESVEARKLDKSFATTARNCRLTSGSLEPLKGPLFKTAWGATYASIYQYLPNEWFTFTGDVDVARTPIAYDTTDRVYYTGTGYPKQTNNTLALSNGVQPAAAYRLGVPVGTQVLLAVTGDPDPEQEGLESTVYYVYSLVTAWGEEGPPSPVSTAATITDGQEVTLTFPSLPTGNYNFGSGALIRVYRSNSGSVATAFQFLVDLPLGTGTYKDTLPAAGLGEVIPSTLWDAPPDDDGTRYPSGEMLGLRALPSGVMVGYSGNTLVYSEAYLPHAWPYAYPINDTIVGIEVTSQGVLIGTNGKPVMAIGLDPQSIVIQELDERRACVSKRSMVDMGEFAIYASQDGLVGIENGSVSLLTEGLFSREQWQRFKPESIHAYRWEGGYVAFWDNPDDLQKGGFIFAPGQKNSAFIELDFYASAGHYSARDDILYLQVADDLIEFDRGTDLEYLWRSKEFQLPQPTAFSVLQVHADTYPVNVNLYRDNVLEVYTVANERPVRLAAGRNTLLSIELQGTATVHDVSVATSPTELAND